MFLPVNFPKESLIEFILGIRGSGQRYDRALVDRVEQLLATDQYPTIDEQELLELEYFGSYQNDEYYRDDGEYPHDWL